MIKEIIKQIIGFIYCKRHNIITAYIPSFGYNIQIINRGEVKFGKEVVIRSSTGILVHNQNSKISLGNNVDIGNHSRIASINSVILKDGVLLGPHVFIADHNHEYRDPNIHIYKQGVMACERSRVLIDDGTWLGTNVVVVGNVHIGKNCVIGANSVVTKDIPDYCVAAGIPCKIIKQYNFETKKWGKI